MSDKPTLQGKVVLEVTIAPSGEVTDCRILSSELDDPDLERKLVARVRMFRFEERDVATMTTTKPIAVLFRLASTSRTVSRRVDAKAPLAVGRRRPQSGRQHRSPPCST